MNHSSVHRKAFPPKSERYSPKTSRRRPGVLDLERQTLARNHGASGAPARRAKSATPGEGARSSIVEKQTGEGARSSIVEKQTGEGARSSIVEKQTGESARSSIVDKDVTPGESARTSRAEKLRSAERADKMLSRRKVQDFLSNEGELSWRTAR